MSRNTRGPKGDVGALLFFLAYFPKLDPAVKRKPIRRFVHRVKPEGVTTARRPASGARGS